MTRVTGIQRNKANHLWGMYTTRWFVALDVSRNKPGNDGAEASGFDADGINRKTILFFTGFPSKLENDGADDGVADGIDDCIYIYLRSR